MFNILAVAIVVLGLAQLSTSPVLQLFCIAFGTILFIVLGEKSSSEEKWELAGLPGREALAPTAALLAAVGVGLVGPKDIQSALFGKFEILSLILSFAVISNGLSRCGFFEFAAYKIVEKCSGDTRRLILYMFILASILTFVTSNDIVVLTLTPIIYSICMNARLANGKLLLLSQFVAANTLSMGLMIGSPTNIIVADYLKMDFVAYFYLMSIPAIVAFMLSLVVVDFINSRSLPDARGLFNFSRLGWHYSEQYRIPSRAPWSEFSPSMGRWFWLFLIAVVALIVTTNLNGSLLWVAIPLILASSVLLAYELAVDELYRDLESENKYRIWFGTIFGLPYGIIFFAIAFFVFAAKIAASPGIQSVVTQTMESASTNMLLAGPAATVASGLLVNLLNDLPAAALIGELFQGHIQLSSTDGTLATTSLILAQSFLIGLNIGCYLTPVGALAGLIWFSQMKSQERRQREVHEVRLKAGLVHERFVPLVLPTRADLIVYGSLHFFFTAILLGLFVPFAAVLLDFFARPVTLLYSTAAAGLESNKLILVVGIVVACFITWKSNEITSKNRVAFSHMSEVFSILNRVAIWSIRHPILHVIVLFMIFVAITGGLIYWVEGISVARFGTHISGDNGAIPTAPLEYLSWFLVFLGSSHAQQVFPQSFLGQFAAGLVPLTAIAAVLYVVKFTSEDNLKRLREALGFGHIPNYRIIVVNHQAKFERAVKFMLDKPNAFCVLLCRADEFERAEHFADSLFDDPRFANRVLVQKIESDAYSLLKELNFATANEIFFLSNLRQSCDIDNMRMLTRIDAWLNSQRASAAEEATVIKGQSASSGAKRSYGDFLGVPKIFFEASSKRQMERIASSLSDLMRYQTVVTAFDDVVEDVLLGNVFGDLNYLNFRLGFAENPSIYSNIQLRDSFKPFGSYMLEDIELSNDGANILQSFYSDHFIEGLRSGRSIRSHSNELRLALPEILGKIGLPSKTGQMKSAGSATVVGVVAKVGNRPLRMVTGNSVVSAQSSTAIGLVLLHRGDSDVLESGVKKDTGSRQRLFIFNYNAYADSFVRKLLRSAFLDRVDLIVMVNKWVNIPDDIANAPGIKIFRRQTVEDAVGMLLPQRQNDNEPFRRPQIEGVNGVEAGDSILVFTDYEDEMSSNVEVVQFIEGLDYRLTALTERGIETGQRDILLMVECNNEETRFLFEHYAVDKLIDTSRLRRTYLEQAISLYHGSFRRMRDAEYAGHLSYAQWGQFHPTMYNFKRAFAYADLFKPFVSELASSLSVMNSAGVEVPAVGMRLGELEYLAKVYAEPPLELIGLCLLQPTRFAMHEDGEFGAGSSMKSIDWDPDLIIERNHVLVFLSIL